MHINNNDPDMINSLYLLISVSLHELSVVSNCLIYTEKRPLVRLPAIFNGNHSICRVFNISLQFMRQIRIRQLEIQSVFLVFPNTLYTNILYPASKMTFCTDPALSQNSLQKYYMNIETDMRLLDIIYLNNYISMVYSNYVIFTIIGNKITHPITLENIGLPLYSESRIIWVLSVIMHLHAFTIVLGLTGGLYLYQIIRREYNSRIDFLLINNLYLKGHLLR